MQPGFYHHSREGSEYEKPIEQTLLPLQLYLSAIINEQFLLTQHLIQNQFRLNEELKKEKQSSDSGQSSLPANTNMVHRPSAEEEEDFKFASENQDDSSSHKPKQEEPLTRLRIRKQFKYDVDSDSENVKREFRKCQTKNIIKNFMKSIFNFIKKHKSHIKPILASHQIPEQDFHTSMQDLNDHEKIKTILELRELWCNHPYSVPLRMICLYFLRRYSLKHIFHSRISNYQVHLKYRCKLMESIMKPNEFTSLKDF